MGENSDKYSIDSLLESLKALKVKSSTRMPAEAEMKETEDFQMKSAEACATPSFLKDGPDEALVHNQAKEDSEQLDHLNGQQNKEPDICVDGELKQ